MSDYDLGRDALDINTEKAQTDQSNNAYLDGLYRERNHLERRLHTIERKIELINKNPIIKEFLDLGR